MFAVLVVVVFFYCSCFAVLLFCFFLFYGYFRLLLFLFLFKDHHDRLYQLLFPATFALPISSFSLRLSSSSSLLLLKLPSLFFLTDSSQCAKDKLVVGDSSKSKYTCGTSSAASPSTYDDGDVWFQFTTDTSGSGSGFILTYKLVDKPVQSKWQSSFGALQERKKE